MRPIAAPEVGVLVLPLHDPPEVDAPDLRSGTRVAQRLERDREFRKPSAIEPAGPHIPHGVPVRIQHVVDNGLVAQRADGRRLEEEPVSPIQEGIEDDREALVLRDVVVVAAKLGDDVAFGVAVEGAHADIDIAVVEEHPHLGVFGGRRALARLLLDEAVDRRGRLVDLLVEPPVELNGALNPDRADRRLAVVVARDRVGCSRRRHHRPASLRKKGKTGPSRKEREAHGQ
jgi:hypothetical protein